MEVELYASSRRGGGGYLQRGRRPAAAGYGYLRSAGITNRWHAGEASICRRWWSRAFLRRCTRALYLEADANIPAIRLVGAGQQRWACRTALAQGCLFVDGAALDNRKCSYSAVAGHADIARSRRAVISGYKVVQNAAAGDFSAANLDAVGRCEPAVGWG